MTKNCLIVVLVGPVGAGKSTQGRLLSSYFKKNNYNIKFTYINVYYPMLLHIIKKFVLFLVRYDARELQPSFVKKLMIPVLAIDSVLLSVNYLFKVLIHSIVSKLHVIIVEEYFIGIFINYFYLYVRGFINKRIFHTIWNVLGRLQYLNPTVIIVLNALPDTLKIRRKKRDYYEKRTYYLEFQQKILQQLKKYFSVNGSLKVKDVDANGSIPSTFRNILIELKDYL